MSRVVGIGRAPDLAGYALAGTEIVEAVDPEHVRRAWDGLADDVALVLLTPEARSALPERLPVTAPLWVVLPA